MYYHIWYSLSLCENSDIYSERSQFEQLRSASAIADGSIQLTKTLQASGHLTTLFGMDMLFGSEWSSDVASSMLQLLCSPFPLSYSENEEI